MSDAGEQGSGPTRPRGVTLGSELVGSVLGGRYRIIQLLGEGAMGAVYLGEHLKIGRQDAIKVLRDSLSADPEALARFNRGSRNVAAIRHPNICTIYDYSDTDEGLQFLAMEYIPGESLKDVLDREGPLPMARAIPILRQVAGALQAAHDAGIVHRDLKPGNIMVMPDRDGGDSIRVVDFDLAKSEVADAGEVTRYGFVVGTPEYMSPEQLTGDRLDGRSDVYSLALVFVRMITGLLPFQAQSTQEMIVKRLTQAPLRLDEMGFGGMPPGVQAAIDYALARDARERTPGASHFAREVETALAGGGAAAGAPSAVPSGTADGVPSTRVATAAADPIPETRLSPAAAAVPQTPAAAVPARGRGLLLAAAVVVVLAAGGGGVLALQRNAAAGEAERAATAAADVESAPRVTLDPLQVADTGRAEPSAPAVREPAGPVAASLTPGAGAAAATPPPPAPPAPLAERPEREPAPAGIRVAPGDAGAVLGRLLVSVDAQASRRVLTAVRDTAEAVWGLRDVPPRQQALAAFVLSQATLYLGSTEQCETWIARARRLNDSPAYQEMKCAPQAG